MKHFEETYDFFKASTASVQYPLTYEKWLVIPDELKVAALFVNFYREIKMAYAALQVYYLDEEDAVSHVCQYLLKNVEKIKADRKRFANPYIYRVAYNSIFGFVRVPSRRDFADNTTSQYFTMDGEEHDVLELIEDDTNCFTNEKFAKIMESLDDHEKSMVSHLIWGSRLKKAEQRRENEILDNLRKAFKSLYEDVHEELESEQQERAIAEPHYASFADVYEMDDDVKSAVVIMSDGEQAVYYGETSISHEGQVKVVFFGAKKDYFVPLEIAKTLSVVDVDMY